MCVAIRSRNQRSWVNDHRARPPKLRGASSSDRSVSTSRSFVGSSNSSRLPPLRSSLARWTRLRSAAGRVRRPCHAAQTLEVEPRTRSRARATFVLPSIRNSFHSGNLLVHRVLGHQRVARLVDVTPEPRWSRPAACRSRMFPVAIIMRKRVVLPAATLGPMMPTMPPRPGDRTSGSSMRTLSPNDFLSVGPDDEIAGEMRAEAGSA